MNSIDESHEADNTSAKKNKKTQRSRHVSMPTERLPHQCNGRLTAAARASTEPFSETWRISLSRSSNCATIGDYELTTRTHLGARDKLCDGPVYGELALGSRHWLIMCYFWTRAWVVASLPTSSPSTKTHDALFCVTACISIGNRNFAGYSPASSSLLQECSLSAVTTSFHT